MSHTIQKNLIMDGPKSALLYIYMQSDGVEGELSNFVLVDPKTDFVQSPIKVQMSITQIWHSFSWFDGMITFDDTVPYPSWVLTRDTVNYQDFRYFGGLKDRSSIDSTGKVLLSTNGFSNAGSVGTMVLEIRKNQPSYPTTYTSPLDRAWPMQDPNAPRSST